MTHSPITRTSMPTAHLGAVSDLPKPPRRTHYLVAALIFTGLAIYGSLVPLRLTPIEFDTALEQFAQIPYLQLGIHSRSDWVANILLFIPLSFLWTAACLVDRSTLRHSVLIAPVVLVACAALSIGIEFTQIWFPPRTVSQNDIAAESIGALIGIVVWLSVGRSITRGIRSYMAMSRSNDQLDWLLRAYVLGLVIYSLLPFDVTIRPAELWEKYRNGRISLVPFSHPYDSLYRMVYGLVANVMVFVPVGMLIARGPMGRGTGLRSLPASIATGALLAGALETCQLFVYSRVVDGTDLITGTIGTAVGAWLVRRWLGGADGADAPIPSPSQGRRRCWTYLGLAAANAVLVALVSWAPYDFTDDAVLIRERLIGLFRVPFSAFYFGNDFNAMVQMTRKVLWFVPFGALLLLAARTPAVPPGLRRILSGAGFVVMLGAAVVIELGKVLVPSRTADFTNILLALMGGAAGMLLAARFFRTGEPRPARRAGTDSASPRFSRIPGMDGLRAIACLSVFGVHFYQLTGVDGRFGPFQVSRFLENGNAVGLLFILSGFFLGLPFWAGREPQPGPGWLRSYALKRIARIAPPYFLCLSLLVLKSRHWETPGERLDTLLHYLFLHNYTESSFYSLNPAFWTLAVQAQFYLIFPAALLFVAWVTPHRRTAFYAWLGLLAGAFATHYGLMYWVLPAAVMSEAPAWTDVVLGRSVLAHLPHFLLGVAAGYGFWRLDTGSLGPKRGGVCEITFWICASVVVATIGTPLDDFVRLPFGRYHFPVVPSLLAVMVICAPYTRWARSLLESRPFRMLGVISFGVYVYHVPSLNAVSRMMFLVGKDPSVHWLAFALLALLSTIAVAAVSYAAVERPILAATKRRSLPLHTARPPASRQPRTVLT